jgi:tetratricopeptide (TPR) repeat protein
MGLRAAWTASIAAAVGLRLWNALVGPVLHGYDGWSHVAYILFLDLHHAIPYADQGWSYFHPPLYYGLGALLAQLGNADALARGLALLGSAASLAIACLAARVVAAARGEPALRSRTGCIAFTAVAFLPVHVYTSPMPGNELVASFFVAALLTAFLAAEQRARPSARLDIATGVLAACAVLTKVTAVVPLAAIGLVAALRALRRDDRAGALRALLLRGVRIGVVLLALAGPYYARNVSAYGTPFVANEYAKMRAIETRQPPGERGWRDFVALPGAAVLRDSSFDAPHLLRSVWGSLYLNAWFDTYRASQLKRWELVPPHDYPIHRQTLLLAGLGLIPTGFALLGAARMLRSAVRDRDAVADLTFAVVSAASLAFFVAFTVRVPTFAAVKASYLLALSLPYGWALARGLESALDGRPWARRVGLAGCAGLAATALVATAIFASGALHPMRPDHQDIHALRAYFGDADSARRWLEEPGVREQRHAIEVVAAVELGAGNAERAAELLRGVAGGMVTPEFVNAFAVASALADRPGDALQLWNRALAGRAPAELRVNRGAVRAAAGDLEGGRADLERALAERPDIEAGWSNLAWIEAAAGDEAAALRAHSRALSVAAHAPRGFPYGVGEGDLDTAGRGERWLLRLARTPPDAKLELYRPQRARFGPRTDAPSTE